MCNCRSSGKDGSMGTYAAPTLRIPDDEMMIMMMIDRYGDVYDNGDDDGCVWK